MQPKILSNQIENAYVTLGKHTIWVPVAAMEPGPTSGPESKTYGDINGGGTTIKTLDFDPSVAEFAYFTIHMPKSWDAGPIQFQVVWTQMTGGSGNVAWTLWGRSLADGDGFTISRSSNTTVVDSGGTTAVVYRSAVSSNVTMPTAGADELVAFNIYRDATLASDTLPVDASLIGVKLLYNISVGNDN